MCPITQSQLKEKQMKYLSKLIRSASTVALAGGVMFGTAGIAQADLTMPYGSGSSAYAYMNVSGSNANVVLTYYNQDGTTAYTSSQADVIPNKRMNVTLGTPPDGAVPVNFTIGSVVLSSDQDLVAVEATDYTGRPGYEPNTNPGTGSTAGTEMSMYDAFNTGSTELYAPYVIRFRSGSTSNASLSTRFTVQNTTGSPAVVYMNYYTQTGSLLGTITRNINSYGSITIDTVKDSDVPAGFTADVNQAGVYITSTQSIAGVAEVAWNNSGGNQNWMGDYSMSTPTNASYKLYSPLAVRVCTPPDQLCSPSSFGNNKAFNSFMIQNTESTSAVVTATFKGTSNPLGGSGNTRSVDYSMTFNLPGKAFYNINLYNGGDVQGVTRDNLFAEGTGLGSAFVGALTVESTAKVVGVGFYQQPYNIQNYVSAFNLVGDSDASNKVYAPWFDRVCTGSCTVSAFEQWTFSNLAIMNVDPTNSVNVSSVDFYDASGALLQSFTNMNSNPISLAPGEAFNFNSRTGSSFSQAQTQLLTNNFNGTVVVNAPSGAKLKGLVLEVKGKNSADMYNAMNR
jgi:hypothetical protein